MARNYVQGKFRPTNPNKYKGDVDNIVYRSSWELTAFKFCDSEKFVLKWSSETMVIPYCSPVDNRTHRYFVDLTVWVLTKTGVKPYLIEIKPLAQTKPPRQTKNKTPTRLLEEVKTYAVNQAKWKAARAFCNKNGFEFLIWTENELVPTKTNKIKRLKPMKKVPSK